MGKYAKQTTVTVASSRIEIEKTIERYGATGFGYMANDARVAIVFQMSDRNVKFLLELPDRNSREFERTPERRIMRSPDKRLAAYEQAVRQRWRALALVIKAKMEAVESGITTFEREFMAHILLPDGRTVGEFMAPQLKSAYEGGEMPDPFPLLGSGEQGNKN